MTNDNTNRQRAYAILQAVGSVNPYNRQLDNKINEYWVYQSGFTASFLAGLMAEDPSIRRRFDRHIEEERHRFRQKYRGGR